jgi:hypothetical protein
MDTAKAEQLCCASAITGVGTKKSPARPKPMIDDTFDTMHADSIERIFDRILFSAKPGMNYPHFIVTQSKQHVLDNRYVNTMILSHRHFTSSPEVLNILANSLDVNFQNELMSLDKKFNTAIRILKYLLAWMRTRWTPDFTTEAIKSSLFKFCERLETTPWIVEDLVFSKFFRKISVYIKTVYVVKVWRL